jgi:hypothetical protein
MTSWLSERCYMTPRLDDSLCSDVWITGESLWTRVSES